MRVDDDFDQDVEPGAEADEESDGEPEPSSQHKKPYNPFKTITQVKTCNYQDRVY